MNKLKEYIKKLVRETLREDKAPIDENKLKEFYKFLLDLGGGDLAGDFEDMKKYANTFNSFEDFVREEVELLGPESPEYAKEIEDKWLSNINEESSSGDIGVGAGSIQTPNWVAPKGQKKNKATKYAEKQGFKTVKKKQFPYNSVKESDYTKASPSSNPSDYLKEVKTLNDIIEQELINEVTYSRFKNEVKFRTKSEQLHKAIREVKRKIQEIDRIVEYTSRMKQELSEGEEGIRYWKATQRNIGSIAEMLTQLNNKIKNLHE